jgi:hypothetical protein
MTETKRSTDNAKASHFSQHGNVESRILDNVLINEATGPFNAEIIYALRQIQHDLLEILSAKPQWAQIYTFHHSALCSPDTIDALSNYLADKKGKIKKPAATAFVMDNSVEGRAIMAAHYRHVYEIAELNFKIFTSVEQAQDWVKLKLGKE